MTEKTAPARAACLYECPVHHGAGARVHTAECVLPSPTARNAYVCDDCRAEVIRQEIAADPYFRGDDYAMFGDGE